MEPSQQTNETVQAITPLRTTFTGKKLPLNSLTLEQRIFSKVFPSRGRIVV